MRSGGAIRRNGRILNGNEDEWSDLKFKYGSPRMCRLMPASVRSE
jgi:hypothetical protein